MMAFTAPTHWRLPFQTDPIVEVGGGTHGLTGVGSGQGGVVVQSRLPAAPGTTALTASVSNTPAIAGSMPCSARA
jgi:hypothetical protein